MGENDGNRLDLKPMRPSQSITEVLQNPLETRLGLGGPPSSPLSPFPRGSRRRGGILGVNDTEPPSPRYNINDFEGYLREVTVPFSEYQFLSSYSSKPVTIGRNCRVSDVPLDFAAVEDVPREYFEQNFDVTLVRELWDPLEDGERHSFDAAGVTLARRRLHEFGKTVELEMFRRVKSKREEILEALRCVDVLCERMDSAILATSLLRRGSEAAAQSVRGGALRVGAMWQRRQFTEEILDVIEVIADLSSTKEDIEILVDAGDFAAALDALNNARRVAEGSKVCEIRSLDGIRRGLRDAEESIQRSLIELFRNLVNNLDSELGTFDAAQEGDTIFPVVHLMSRLRRVPALVELLCDSMASQIRSTLSDSAPITVPASHQYVENVKAVEGVVARGSAILTALKQSVPTSDLEQWRSIVQAHESLSTALDDALSDLACRSPINLQDFIHGGLVGIRTFAGMMAVTMLTASKVERLLDLKRGALLSLSSAVRERSHAFVSALHKHYSESISKFLAKEVWSEVPVPAEVQSLVDQLRKVSMLRKRVARGDVGPHDHTWDQAQIAVSALWAQTVAGDDDNQSEEGESLLIISEEFRMVPSGLLVLKAVVIYTALVTELGGVVPIGGEVVRRCFEYLRLFNETTSRLVLGAGAMRTAGLKSITARHLALASRVVGSCVHIVPLILDATETYVPRPQRDMVRDLGKKMIRDLEEHQEQLLSKILLVMYERLSHHRRNLAGLPWDSEVDVCREGIPSKPIVSLMKETTVLHRILMNFLPRNVLVELFVQICEAYGERLSETVEQILSQTGSPPWVRLRISADINHLFLKMRGMEAVATFEDGRALTRIEELKVSL